jgi:hypothetical protein
MEPAVEQAVQCRQLRRQVNPPGDVLWHNPLHNY